MKDIQQYTRVSEILSPFSGLKNIPPEILQNAANRGTKVHEICDSLINDIGVLNLDENVAGYIQSFEQWLPGKKFLDKPERFFCDELMITGEIDGIYHSADGLVLVDFKTPAKKSSTWNLQLSAYAYLCGKAGYKIDFLEVVRLDKTGKAPEVIRYDDQLALFLKCIDVYRYFYKDNAQDDYYDYL
jgi:ATP-dependent exoDNAse (exonuclease V) beta subunit